MIMGAWGLGKKRLPYDAEVEYLQSTGAQWIDTGIIFGADNGFSITYSPTNADTRVDNSSIFGSRTTYGDTRMMVGFNANSTETTGIGCGVYVGWGVLAIRTSSARIANIGSWYTATANISTATATDGLGGTASLSTLPTQTRTAYIFGANTQSGPLLCRSRIAACRIYQSGVLVRDYIPVRFTNEQSVSEGAMYDRVSGQLFRNQGTGSFVVGPDVVPVEYIESTGTQWIGTGIYLTNNHSVEIDFQLTTLSQSRTGLFGGLATSRYGCLISPTTQKLEFGYGSSNVWYQIKPDTSRHYAKQLKNLIYVDNVLINTFEQATFTQNYSAPLGNFNYVNYTPVKAKYYSSKWYDGDTLVRDFVSVRVGTGSTWEGAMMDTLTRRIYRNAGTGNFSYGADKAS